MTVIASAVILLFYLASANAIFCTKCNQARGEESSCNNQPIDFGNSVECGARQACTIDVRCDGRGRVLWIKGCEAIAGITAFDTLLCHADGDRCSIHCNSQDYCNMVAPADLVPSLSCAVFDDPVLTSTAPKPPPQAGAPLCYVCEKAEGRDDECNQVMQQCGEGEVCWTKFKCRKQGEPGRALIYKRCVRENKCDSFMPDVTHGYNDNGNYVARECCNTDLCNADAAMRLEPVVLAEEEFCDNV